VKAYLEPDEINRMEQAAANLRDRLLVHLLFHVGCRVSEALALKVEDVDFTRGTITIVRLKHRVKLLCPSCGARLGLGHSFCPKCGAKVDEAS
jgi:integrase/recombinase XerD